MVEGPDTDDVEAGRASVLVTRQVGGGLAGGVGTGRPQGRVLVLGLLGLVSVAVDHTAADVQDAGPAAPADDRVVEAARGSQVACPRSVGFAEGLADVGIAGQVIDLPGLD